MKKVLNLRTFSLNCCLFALQDEVLMSLKHWKLDQRHKFSWIFALIQHHGDRWF